MNNLIETLSVISSLMSIIYFGFKFYKKKKENRITRTIITKLI